MSKIIAILFASILAVSTATLGAGAADPIIGSWKLNLLESEFALNAPPAPKEQTETYRELNSGEIELTYNVAEADGSSRLLILAFPSQGGIVKVLKGDAGGATYVQTRIAAGEWYTTYLRDGKQYLTRHKVASKNGKKLRQTLRGVDSQGKPWEQLRILDRQ